ncbi:uncharacterized protein LOC135172908 [Diachasmimorpha longicaudata]|uniref:uncharacterized protein LOC135172908 n=1 Tax=Diachasmimorpha longicaudata TaxID=58733 RepID=UPI0030B8D71B
MYCGPEPGSVKCEITWTKVKNTIPRRMEGDSLIHLLTAKKKLKRRTKLLNYHLRKHVNNTISYANYIKAKTAILRSLSEDEETSDSDVTDDLSKRHGGARNSKNAALRSLIEEMILESPGSADEFEPKRKCGEHTGRRKRDGLRDNPKRRKNSETTASESEWEKAPVAVVNRSRGRPRKYPLATKTPVRRAGRKSLRSSMIRGNCQDVEGSRDSNVGNESVISYDESSTRDSESRRIVGERNLDVEEESGDLDSSSVIRMKLPDKLRRRKSKSRTVNGEKESDVDDESDQSDSSMLTEGDKPEAVEYSTRSKVIAKKRRSIVDELETPRSSTLNQGNKFVDVDSLRRKLMSRKITDRSENWKSSSPVKRGTSQDDQCSTRVLRSRTISLEENTNLDTSGALKSPAPMTTNKSPVKSLRKTSTLRSLKENNLAVQDTSNKFECSTATEKRKSQNSKSFEKSVKSRAISDKRDSNGFHESIEEIVTPQQRTDTVPIIATNTTAIKNFNSSNDVNSHIFEKISRMISNGVDPHLATDASKIYSTDGSTNGQETPGGYSTDAEFRTPQTSDCDISDEEEKKNQTFENSMANSPEFPSNVSGENSMDNNDMFEEEKVIFHSQLSIVDSSSYIDSQNDHTERRHSPKSPVKNSLICQNDSLQDKKVADDLGMNGVPDMSNVEDSKLGILNNEREDRVSVGTDSIVVTFTQEFDAKEEKATENLEEYVENAVKAYDERFVATASPPTNQRKNSFKEFRASGNVVEKINESNNSVSKGTDKSTGKASIPSRSVKKIVTSPKTPEDVKRNLIAVLDNVSDESSLGNVENTEDNSNVLQNKVNTPDAPTSSVDGDASRPGDEFPVAPADSGIDEESQNSSPQEYRNFGEEKLKSEKNTGGCSASKKREKKIVQDAEESKTQKKAEVSPSKKIANLKITCTEVVKSKYLIIKNRENGNGNNRSSGGSPTAGKKVVSRSTGPKSPGSAQQSLHESDDEVRVRYGETSDEDLYNNFSSFGYQVNSYSINGNDNEASDSAFPCRSQEDEEWERARREKRRSLAVATESESLKYVLNHLPAQGNQMVGGCEEKENALEAELLVRKQLESETGLENEGEEGAVRSRPTNILEFIEGTHMVPLEAVPSFTLGDIGEDDDIYLMEIPKSVLQRNLVGQRLRLGEKKIVFGEGRYQIQRKEAAAMSCILHRGDKRNRYKTGIIEPVDHIIVRQQFKDDIMTTPKIEVEPGMSVPFPKNIKSRNPLVLGDQTSTSNLLESTRIEHEEGEVRGEQVSNSHRKKRRASATSDESERISSGEKCKRPRVLIAAHEEDAIEDQEHSHDESNIANRRNIKDKKESKRLRKLFCEQESLIDIPNDSCVEDKTKKRRKRLSESSYKCEDLPTVTHEEIMSESENKGNNDEAQISKRSFYAQMMEDSD